MVRLPFFAAGVCLLLSAAPARAGEPAAPADRDDTANDGPTKPVLPYTRGEPVPDGYHFQTHPHVELAAGGGVILGMAWIVGFVGLVAGGACRDSPGCVEADFFLPAIGPFIGAASAHSPWFLLGNGLVQAGGLAMLIGGVAWRERELVRDAAQTGLTVAPAMVPGGAGLSMSAKF